MEPENNNPSALEEPLPRILQELRTSLERNGVVQQRPNKTFRLRWREYDAAGGFTRQRSLGLGRDPDQAAAVEALIVSWREASKAAEANAKREAREQARAEAANEAEERLLRRLVAMGLDEGRDGQRRIIKELKAAMAAGPRAALRFVLSLEERKARKPGRPRRMRIW